MRNAVQKLLYAFALCAMLAMVLSGLVLWKPVQFHELGLIMGQYEGARYVHFFGMVGIVLFLIVHIALTLLVPKVLLPMITGRAPPPRLRTKRPEQHHDARNLERRLREGGLGKNDVVNLERRLFLRHGLSFGALTMLSGCDVVTNTGPVDAFLRAISRFNDGVQASLFNPHRLAPTFPESMVAPEFRFNAQYGIDKIPVLNPATWRLQPSGLVSDKRAWTLDQLQALPQRADVTRHVCVEGWSMIGKWGGVPLRTFLERVGADPTAPATSASTATTRSATRPASTWPRRCMRRPSCASPMPASRSSRGSARRCASRFRPSWGSSSRNLSRRSE